MPASFNFTKLPKPEPLAEPLLNFKRSRDASESSRKHSKRPSKKTSRVKPKTKPFPSGQNLPLFSQNPSPKTMNPSSAPTPQTPAPQEPGTLPAPHLFDIVPPLHALLSRLLLPSPGLLPTNTSDNTQTSSATVPPPPVVAAEDGSAALDIHNLDAAANAIRTRIQKARAAVKALPDVELTIEEQEEEIRELEDRIGRMRGMMADLKRQAVKQDDTNKNGKK